MQIPDSVVIVGAGQAGQQLAASLRQEGYPGQVTLLGAEEHLPYQRPPLSKGHLSGGGCQDDLSLERAEYYQRHAIDLRTQTTVKAIDRAKRQVILGDGTAVPYDHLVLATGAQNRRLPPITASSARILQLRSAGDAEMLRKVAEDAKSIVIIGGGFIGLEVAATLGAGRKITLVETMGRIMDRAVSSILAQHMRHHHEARGVEFLLNCRVATIDDNGPDGFSLMLDDGTMLATDAVLCAIGIEPQTELAQAAGLEIRNGIVVDGVLTTSDPAISAIGDCCAFPVANGQIRLETVHNAVSQANHLAKVLCGQAPPAYREIPTFWSEQGGLLLQIVGLTERSDHSVLRGDPQSGAFSIFRFRDRALVAVESLNRGGDHMLGRRLLAQGISPSREQVQDPGFDLRSLLAQPVLTTIGNEGGRNGT